MFFLTSALSQTSFGSPVVPIQEHDYIKNIGGRQFGYWAYKEGSGRDVTLVFYGWGSMYVPLTYQTVIAGAVVIPLLAIGGGAFLLRRRA